MMQLSPFGTMPLVEFNRASTITMTISVDTGSEVNASIYWEIDGQDMIDNTHWCWLETIRDHGKYHCKECREKSPRGLDEPGTLDFCTPTASV